LVIRVYRHVLEFDLARPRGRHQLQVADDRSGSSRDQ
jgi:hypothetical protein